MLIGLFVSRDQNKKDSRQVRKALTFQTKTNIFHHYKGILLLKLLWQNQNYQLVLGGSRDWSLVIWLTALNGFAVSQRSLRINLSDSHPNLVVNSYAHYILWRLPLCALPWLIMTLQWVTTLLSMPHCGITVGNDITRDIHCEVTIGNDVAMCTYHGITMHNDVAMNLFCYVLLDYAKL